MNFHTGFVKKKVLNQNIFFPECSARLWMSFNILCLNLDFGKYPECQKEMMYGQINCIRRIV